MHIYFFKASAQTNNTFRVYPVTNTLIVPAKSALLAPYHIVTDPTDEKNRQNVLVCTHLKLSALPNCSVPFTC